MPSVELERVLAHFRELGERVSAPDIDLAVLREVAEDACAAVPAYWDFDAEIVPVDAGGVPAEWILAPGSATDRRLVAIHGGGHMLGSVRAYRPFFARLSAATGCAVLALDYRLAPEHLFPAALDDCVSVLRYARDHGPDGEGLARRLYLEGDSAGGTLTLTVLLECKRLGLAMPDAAVALSPGTDSTLSGESFVTRADADPLIPKLGPAIAKLGLSRLPDPGLVTDPRVSPLFGDLSGLPPLLLQVGDLEVLLSDSLRFADKAEGAGVDVTLQVWDHMPHVFQAFAGFLPEADRALADIAAFLSRHD